MRNRFARNREVEVPRLDDAGMDRAHGDLEDTFAQGGPIDMPFPFKRWKHSVDRKVLAQGVHIGPVVVQGDAPGIRVPLRHQSEPILNLTLLPIDGGNIGGHRREYRSFRRNACPQQQITRVSRLFPNVVNVVTGFGRRPVFGKHESQTAALS